MKAAAECIPIKEQNRIPWETLAVKEKQDMKTASLFIKRNPTNANAQKLRALSELTHTKKNK